MSVLPSNASSQPGSTAATRPAGDQRLRVRLIDWSFATGISGMGTLASSLDTINPSLTRYRREEPAPVLPLRDEPDLLSWLETSGRLVADEETAAADVSTVEEEELSALMGEKEDYNQVDEQPEEDWED